MKKLISILLVSLLLLSCVWVGAAAEAPNGLVLPTVYIRGKTDELYNDIGTADEWMVSDSSRVFSKEVTDVKAYALDQAKKLLPEFVAGMLTAKSNPNSYDTWAEDMSHLLEPIYKDFVLDKNGNARPNSGAKMDYTTLVDQNKVDSQGRYNAYAMPYDWRLSPLDVAESLNTYIETVLRVTGKSKVNLVSRCEGCCAALAYLTKYGTDKIANNVMLCSSANGVVYCSNIFAGKFNLNGDAINRYVGRNFNTDSNDAFGNDLFGGDQVVLTFLKETVTLLSVTGALNLPSEKIVEMVNKLAPKVYPGLLMNSYGTCPSYWAMVRHDDYEDAKKLAGLVDEKGVVNPEWENFVAKIDDYHYNVQQKGEETLKNLTHDDGTPMVTGMIVKYGAESLPIIQDCDWINDNTLLVKDASYGATTAKIGETLPEDYIAKAVADGKGAYISPDKQIDASTGLFPDSTWYLKNFDHYWWGTTIDDFIRDYIKSNGTMRPGENGAMPRFNIDIKDEGVKPMDETNANNGSDYYTTNKAASFLSFFTAFLPMLQRLINFIKSKLGI